MFDLKLASGSLQQSLTQLSHNWSGTWTHDLHTWM